MSFIDKNNSTMEINFSYQINEKNSFGIKGTMNGEKNTLLIKIIGVSNSTSFEQSLSLAQFKAIYNLINKFDQAIALKKETPQRGAQRQRYDDLEEEDIDEPDFF